LQLFISAARKTYVQHNVYKDPSCSWTIDILDLKPQSSGYSTPMAKIQNSPWTFR